MAPTKLKQLLIAFCLLSGGFSTYLMTQAIFGKTKQQPAMEIERMSVPSHVDRSGSEINEGDAGVSHDLFLEIQAYKYHMDSLGQAIRAGLLDSIRILEQIYQSQK